MGTERNEARSKNKGSHPQVRAATVAAVASLLVAFVTAWATLRAKTSDTMAGANAKLEEIDKRIAVLVQDTKFPFIPAGTIQAFGGEPDTAELKKKGWLLCDGRSYATNEYSGLFA